MKTTLGRYLPPHSSNRKMSVFLPGGWRVVCAISLLSSCLVARPAIVGPYTPDDSTLHLWHFDEPAENTTAVDAIEGGIVLDRTGPATLGNPSFGNFGASLMSTNGGYANGGIQPLAQFVGESGAFTFEAIIRPSVNPLQPPNQMNIIGGERAGGDPRSWQFRINTLGELHFITLGAGIVHFMAPLPSAGPNAAVQGQWYHVAVTYTGEEGVDGNLKLFWTLLDSNRTEAALLWATNMAADLGGEPLFTVGTSGRNPNGEAFRGLIDEVRISSVGRAADQMMFSAGGPPTPPAFVVEPEDQFIGAGETLALRALASGSLPIAYRWQLNEADLPDQASEVLAISNVTSAAAGGYRVIASNAFGSATSIVAQVTVGVSFSELFHTGVDDTRALLPAAAVDPHYQLVESADPSFPGPGTIVYNDTSAPFPSAANNGPDSKWIGPQENPGANVEGVYVYRTEFLLDTANPASAVLQGRWSSDNHGLAILLNGNDTGFRNLDPEAFRGFASFSITNGFVSGVNQLEFVVTNTTASVTAFRAELRGVAVPLAAAAPQIVTQPQSRTVRAGVNVTFPVIAVGSPPLVYQWLFNGDPLIDATNRLLRLDAVDVFDDTGDYSVIVSNFSGSATSQVASLTVVTENQPPAVNDDALLTVQDQPLIIPFTRLLNNDVDPDGDPLTITDFDTFLLMGTLTIEANRVIYMPPAGFGGESTFDYQADDNLGGQAMATASILVVRGPIPSENSVRITTTAQGYLLEFNGQPGSIYEVQRATDLGSGNWNTLVTTTAAAHGFVQYEDTDPPAAAAFYRMAALASP